MSNLLAKVAKNYQSSTSSDLIDTRKDYIDRLENGQGALDFVEDIKKYGTNDKGEPLTIRPWFEEYCRLIADVRIGTTYTSGSAQVGKTLAHTLLVCWLSANARLNTIYAYAQERTLNRCVPLQFRPVMESWLKRSRISLKNNEGTRSNTLYQVNGGTNIFTYVSTNKGESKAGGATAGSSVVSVSADIAFLEERSQYPAGADAPVERRLDAGRLKTHPIRQLGTPGHGRGIEEEIEKADYVFYPHCTCNGCSRLVELNPKGTMLKAFDRTLPTGETEKAFLSESGRPIKWYYKDENDPIHSAYFACPDCETEITKEQRLDSRFYCVKSGVALTEFLDTLEPTDRRIKAGIVLSPLLRDTSYNLAAEIINNGLETTNPDDWQQQRLGLASETGNTCITYPMIKSAISAPRPRLEDIKTRKSVRIAGIDQGTAQHWIIMVDYILPDDWIRLDNSQIIDKTLRVVQHAGEIIETDINNTLDHWGVEFGMIDNEPNRSVGLDKPLLVMGDQKPKLKDSVKETIVKDGGVEYPAWDIRNDKFLRHVLTNFALCSDDGYPLARLPQDWERWTRILSERSPVRHLMAVRYDPATGEWVRPADHCDHIYYAFMFAEAAFHIWLMEGCRGFEWWKYL